MWRTLYWCPLKCNDELDKNIEEAIENIQKSTCKKNLWKKEEEEEGKGREELESVWNESEEALQKETEALVRSTHEYNRVLNKAEIKEKECSSKIVGVEHCVSSMEKEQWMTMKNFHVMMMELW